MTQPPPLVLFVANATLAAAIVALALTVASAVPRSRARRLPGGWAFVAILLYLVLEATTDALVSIGWFAEARWTTVARAGLVTAYVLAWRAVLLAAYPPPTSPCEQAATVVKNEPLTAAVEAMVAKVENKGE